MQKLQDDQFFLEWQRGWTSLEPRAKDETMTLIMQRGEVLRTAAFGDMRRHLKLPVRRK